MNAHWGLQLNWAVTWLVMLTMLMSGCATVKLEGIVVDSQRLARSGETGLTRVERNGATVEGYAGMALKRGDRVETGPNAEVVIRYPSGTEVLMRPNSSGRVGSFTEVIGEIFVKVKGLFSVETTFVRAAARGTAYLVRATSNGETTVIVFDGKVNVDSTTGAWAPVILGAGSMALAHPSPSQPMLASADELNRTKDWVEPLERLASAPAGVSGKSELAGHAIGALVVAILGSRGSSSDQQQPVVAARVATTGTPETSKVSAPLVAPSGLQPGAEQQPGPTQNCIGDTKLQWNAVQGAQDYIVTLESLLAQSRKWQKVSVAPVSATQAIIVGSKGLSGSNRWSVQARNGATIGPVSRTMYFLCSFIG
jgi:hypothetical protein